MPIPPWQREPSFDDQRPHPLLEPEDEALTQTISHSTISTARNSTESVGVATAVLMPSRITAPPPTTLHAQRSTTPVQLYTGYEHGAPLSDIYEESEATGTPRSTRTIRDRNDRSPSPVNTSRPGTETPTRPSLRHKKRASNLSTSSSGGSDVGDWENFDTSKVLSSRVAADLAQMKREDTLDVESQDAASRRQSREEEELAALNARAEKILENARKRLTHMEDNLKVARNSIILPQRSPNLGGEHQPVGGLYRSISAAGASKQRGKILPIRTSASLQHMRGNSETGVPSTNKRLSRLEERSASAMEYGSPMRYSLFPDTTQTTPSKVQPSPASSRSFNSPLRPLQEEDRASPSTAETTPESAKLLSMRGLGIHAAAAVSRENLASMDSSTPQQTTTPTLIRSTSSASTKSTKELKEQMTDLKSRIADLRSKAQADHLRRRSIQSVRSSSPFTNAEQWYASSPAYKEPRSPVNASAGVGWSPSSPTGPQASLRTYDGQADTLPITPAGAKFLDVDRMTPDTEGRLMSSARTDRNTPSLVRRHDVENVDQAEEVDESEVSSVKRRSEDDADGVDEDEPVEEIAENDEEQIYLNEVLEESLRAAEVEPEVPPIPGSYFESADGVPAYMNAEAERHEDRLDAFDYENMFLHSAMGTYTGKSLNGSESGSDEDSDGDSVETSRAGARTPLDTEDLDNEADVVIEEVKKPQSIGLGIQKHMNDDLRAQVLGSPSQELPEPPKPWTHARSKSNESVTTSATFETATEGYDETPSDILRWDPMPSSSLGYSPTSYAAYRGTQKSPAHGRHGFSSPTGGGRNTPTARSPIVSSPLRNGQHFEPTYDQRKASASPGIGLGVIGGENAQFINDNGVPERFQGKKTPSPAHSRQSSTATVDHMRPESQATVVAASPAKANHKRLLSASRIHTASPSGSNAPQQSSPVIVTVASSPQRKVVINRSLQQPEPYVLEPQLVTPPEGPLPPPPSSAALQAQMASPKKIMIKNNSKEARPSTSQKRTPPQPISDISTPPSLGTTSTPQAQPMPNTEILMESLIKLADPSFSLAPGIRFDEVDKNLVLGLLGAVGGVCNNILTASIQSGSPAMGKKVAEERVATLRRRLEAAAHVLEGRDEERISVSRQGLRIKEI